LVSDWNWFFSSVAQSSAAIVGIFAAFIITKIINNQLEYNKLKRFSVKMILESEKLIEKARATRIAWYNDEVFKIEMLKMIEALKRKTIEQPEQYAYFWRFSPLAPKWHMEEKLKEFLRVFKQKSVNTGRPIKDLIIESEPGGELLILHYRQGVIEETKIINDLINDTRHNIREIKSLNEEISRNPHSSNLVTFSIIGTMLMFIIGVIYPLLKLPYGISINNLYDIRIYVLGAITFIFGTIMGVFMAINIKLKYPSDIINKLRAYSVMEAYSPYFKEIDEKFTLH